MAQMVSDIETVINHRDARREAREERQGLLDEIQRTSADKENLVRKTLAAQRARFGAGGGGGGMSKDAVLKRMQTETAQPFENKLRTANERLHNVRSPRALNLIRTALNRV